ncbi:MAG: class IV adenylate cyclase [Sedimenticola sp.]
MIEQEKRYYLTDDEYSAILSSDLNWSESMVVTDITFGLSGATSMQTHGWVIRVRKKGEKIVVDYKAPINDEWSKWEEVAMEVSSFSSALKLFTKIGLKPGLVLDRQRREAKLDRATLSIDDFRYLGKFIEIEVNGEDEDAQQLLDACIVKLGLEDKVSQKPYGTLLLEKMDNDTSLKSAIEKHVIELTGEEQ